MDDENNPYGARVGGTLKEIRATATDVIRQDEEPDMELLDILTRRIVVSSPDEDAVGQAMADIKKLADERVKDN